MIYDFELFQSYALRLILENVVMDPGVCHVLCIVELVVLRRES